MPCGTIVTTPLYRDSSRPIFERVADLLGRMSVAEKIGQLQQSHTPQASHIDEVRRGSIGSFIWADTAWAGRDQPLAVKGGLAQELQRIAVEESRLGIPLTFARDVIHGYRTTFPIPLAQAASFSPALVEEAAAIAAREARADGIHWTFAPMLDIARDPRWGRIAEGYGEDPLLCSRLAVAAVRGFQGDDLAAHDRLAACAKHFIGYGAAEGGRDYNSTEISDFTLQNVYLPPFRAAVDAGCATVMAAFHELGGEPCTGSSRILRELLRGQLGFTGPVVSDWNAVEELLMHGVVADRDAAASLALTAGIDVDMVSGCFREALPAALAAGTLPIALVDQAVERLLTVKFRLGLFEQPSVAAGGADRLAGRAGRRSAAKRAAHHACILLSNNGVLPLKAEGLRLGLSASGALMDVGHLLHGTWTLDAVKEETPSLREAILARLEQAGGGEALQRGCVDEVLAIAAAREMNLVVLGESPARSGEAACVTDLGLPPGQIEHLRAVKAMGRPVVAVVLAGRPLVLSEVERLADAVLLVLHPGCEGAAAMTDILFGDAEPLGRLPVSLPRATGQVPIHYSSKATGRPPKPDDRGHIIWSSGYLDCQPGPLHPFGYGLGYTTWSYSSLHLNHRELASDGTLTIRVTVANTGTRRGRTVAQLYLRDLVSRWTRPVRELADFQAITLDAGASSELTFTLPPAAFAYRDPHGRLLLEPGAFRLWVGGDSDAELHADVTLL